MRIAVADLGTNSTRLLVASVGSDGSVEELDRRTDVTRLGDRVDATGRLAEDAMERVHTRLASYAEVADAHGVQRRIAVATSAVRDAENGEEFRAAVERRHGFEVRVISGGEEARLTFLGAMSSHDGDRPTLVFDIGGGSTEYVIGTPGEEPRFHVSTRMGSVRQTERHVHTDPPRAEELGALAEAAAGIVTEAVPEDERSSVDDGIAVAGTATSLAAIEQRLEPYDPAKVQGYVLTLSAAERLCGALAAMPVSERREVPGLLPGRAPTIVAGAVILVESMRAFGLDSVEVSDADILHGAAIHTALYRGEDGGRTG
jgi:exopolyphosphatase/guanosine-5'-triphosphate,3'-diphosphate pyrophosphatase